MRDAGAGDFRRRHVDHRPAIDADGPVCGAPESRDNLGELSLAIAGDAGNPERFTRVDLQIDIVKCGQSFFAKGADSAQLEHGFPRQNGLVRLIGWVLD